MSTMTGPWPASSYAIASTSESRSVGMRLPRFPRGRDHDAVADAERRALVGAGVLHRREAGGAQGPVELIAAPASHHEVVAGGDLPRAGRERMPLGDQQPSRGRIEPGDGPEHEAP